MRKHAVHLRLSGDELKALRVIQATGIGVTPPEAARIAIKLAAQVITESRDGQGAERASG